MDVMGIINVNEPEGYLQELTEHRPLASVPFGGRYRLIDFVLSNMANSGITNVGILIQHKYRSLMDHLRSGKEWDLARKRDGLIILPPAYVQFPLHTYRGDVENFYINLDYIQHSKQKYVIVAGVNMVCNIDYRKILRFHQEKGADVTTVYTEQDCSAEDCSGVVGVSVAQDGCVTDMQVNPGKVPNQKISMEMFIMEREFLVDLIKCCVAHGDYDFIKHCLIKNMDKISIYGYPYQGYLARIYSVQSYFKYSMDLLKPSIWREVFSKVSPIYTKVKDEPPARYVENAKVTNTLVASGCYIGGRVENSILFRGVKIEQGAYIKNSIIMQNSEIASGVMLQNIICDKDVRITADKQLKGECNYPLVIRKGRVI
jgi:glucose-1-phosphate adenylyltransferase